MSTLALLTRVLFFNSFVVTYSQAQEIVLGTIVAVPHLHFELRVGYYLELAPEVPLWVQTVVDNRGFYLNGTHFKDGVRVRLPDEIFVF